MSFIVTKKVITREITCESDWFIAYLLGDLHVGHECFLKKPCVEMVGYIKDRPENGVILTGDLTENVIPGSKGTVFELNIASPTKQREEATRILSPIEEQILAGVDGNHSYRSHKAADFCPDGAVMSALGCKDKFLGYGGFLKLILRKGKKGNPITYNVWIEHGHGGASTPVGKLRSMLNMVNLRLADGYFCGHHHLKMIQGLYHERIRGTREVKEKIILGCSGSYLYQPEYALRGGYRFDSLGVTKIMFCTTRKDIHGSI